MPIAILEDAKLSSLEKKIDKVAEGIEKNGLDLLPAITTVATNAAGEVTKYICTLTWVEPEYLEEEEDDDDQPN